MNIGQENAKIKINKNSVIPMYQQILNEISARIASGEWTAGAQIPTEAELESQLQVSRVTIRQALSAAVEEGLVVRLPGKGTFVSGKDSSTAIHKPEGFIGYVVPHLSSSFNVQILLGVESILKEKGYHLIFCNSEGDLSKENQLLQSLETNGMSGYIVQPVYAPENDRSLIHLASKGDRIVLIDRNLPGIAIDTVMSNHFEGGQRVVRHLIDQGYREIVYLAHEPIQLPSIAERLRGYQAAMTSAKLNPQAPFVVGGPIELGYVQDQNSPTLHENLAVEMIADLLRGPARPEAIVAMNDLVAMLVLEAAEQVGLRIPDDLGVVGFDNLDCAVTNDLTTAAQRPYEIGSEAARLLLQRIHGDKDASKQMQLPTQLIIRGSSLNPNQPKILAGSIN
ncbi:MAG TPA: GntR family transcriptional regulator [Anaerolineales bacterium]|nr:GntR family transcriptional regulator [Anaerolineales bacterium]